MNGTHIWNSVYFPHLQGIPEKIRETLMSARLL